MESITLEEKFKLVSDSIRSFPLQLEDSWKSVSKIELPPEYHNIQNIVLCGMGGSALGGRMIDSLYANKLRVPLEIFNEYDIPSYVNHNSLVILSSYSGATEETIHSYYQAAKKSAKLFAITAGGKLEALSKENGTPFYKINKDLNPSGQPRLGVGFSIGCLMALFNKLNVLYIGEDEIRSSISLMNELSTEYNENSPKVHNLAFAFSKNLKGKFPVFVASEHLFGVTYTIKNMVNENAKTFSDIFSLPELNHHLMEGLKNPAKLRENMVFVFVESELYRAEIIKRYQITREVVDKNGYSFHVFSPRSDSKLKQIFEVIMFGSYVSYFLTKEYGIDPLAIPWVDYFKEKLAK
jgi:glucose/mannose-6-phosphate isomerase